MTNLEIFNEIEYLRNQIIWVADNDYSTMSDICINQMENRILELQREDN